METCKILTNKPLTEWTYLMINVSLKEKTKCAYVYFKDQSAKYTATKYKWPIKELEVI